MKAIKEPINEINKKEEHKAIRDATLLISSPEQFTQFQKLLQKENYVLKQTQHEEISVWENHKYGDKITLVKTW